MFGIQRKNLLILIILLAIVLLAKFVYLDRQAARSTSPELEVETEIEVTTLPTPPVTEVPSAVAKVLTPEEIEQIEKEDEEHAQYYSMAFPAGKLLRKKELNSTQTAHYFLLQGGGELMQVYEGEVLLVEVWTAANGNSIERSYTPEGRVITLTVKEGSYAYTNIYDAQSQIVSKVEKVNSEIRCIHYEQRRPVTRTLGPCNSEEVKELENVWSSENDPPAD